MTNHEITWNGLTATYHSTELQMMKDIRKAGASEEELAAIHELKAVLQGTLREWEDESAPTKKSP